MKPVFILAAILIFGVLIAVHELGHFVAAKLCGVRVNEFSIGMGPLIWQKEKGETQYSLRALPIGGYCAMEGEDDDSADPRAFGRAAGWKKFIILCAGAAMNFLTGLLILLALILLLVGIVVLLVTQVFTVKKVNVVGNELYTDAQIEEIVLSDEYSWTSLYVFLKYKFVDTKEVPFIDTMEVSLEDPQTLRIKVYEKGRMGYLYISSIDENAYFDKDGFVVETSAEKVADTPKITGIECNEVVLYEKLPIDEDTLRDILTLTQTLKRSNLVPDSIAYGADNAPVLKYGNVKVEMGSLELLTQKVERLDKILPQLSGMQGTLHLENWTEETTNIVFDKKE